MMCFDPISYDKAEKARKHSENVQEQLNQHKLDYIEQLNKSPNMFNVQNITIGKDINQSTGEIIDSAVHSISEPIKVKKNTTYWISGLAAVRRYDKEGNYISGTSNISQGTFNSLNADYIVLRILNGSMYNFRMYEGDSDLGIIENGYSPIFENTQIQLKALSNNTRRIFEPLNIYPNKPFEVIDVLDRAYNIRSGNNYLLITDDYSVRWKHKEKSLRLTTASTNTGSITFDLDNPIELTGVSEFIMLVYIEDASKITTLELQITNNNWKRGATEFVDGWNVLRYGCVYGNVDIWEQATGMRCDMYISSPTTIYIGGIYAIKQDKAKILLINDHGYSNFKNVAYPQLKALGIPTTWAINPGRLGESVTDVESILTQEDIDELAYDPYSEFSMHNWNPTNNATANMSADELLEDTHKCMTYLKKNGILPRYPWRAAFTHNLAPEHAVLQPYLDAYATPSENAGIELYPFRNCYNVNRIALHSPSSDLDRAFEQLQKTHSLLVCYTHGLDDTGGIHMTTSQLNYLLSKIEEGVSEGWLEGTTFSKLRGQYGGDYSDWRYYLDIL